MHSRGTQRKLSLDLLSLYLKSLFSSSNLCPKGCPDPREVWSVFGALCPLSAVCPESALCSSPTGHARPLIPSTFLSSCLQPAPEPQQFLAQQLTPMAAVILTVPHWFVRKQASLLTLSSSTRLVGRFCSLDQLRAGEPESGRQLRSAS